LVFAKHRERHEIADNKQKKTKSSKKNADSEESWAKEKKGKHNENVLEIFLRFDESSLLY
jgi:hypothetical protein